MRIPTNFDPVAFLRSKGFSAHQETSPTYGYSGTFTPEVVFGHWTASSPGSDTAASVVRNRHYASCTNRAAHTAFGGYRARQGHGGTGRVQPMSLARGGQMTAVECRKWMASRARDDTSSMPNTYGMSFCIDCTLNENITQAQYDAWLAVGAMWLYNAGMTPYYSMFHSTSTDRKIDVDSLVVAGKRLTPDDFYSRLQYWINQFKGVTPPTPTPPTPQPQGIQKMYAVANHPKTDGYAICKPDGGVYNFDTTFYGAANAYIMAGERATDMCWHPSGEGYWVVSSDGGVFAFGKAPFKGSVHSAGVLPPGAKLNGAATKIESSLSGNGYRISCDDGGLFCFGDAPFKGNVGTVDNK